MQHARMRGKKTKQTKKEISAQAEKMWEKKR